MWMKLSCCSCYAPINYFNMLTALFYSACSAFSESETFADSIKLTFSWRFLDVSMRDLVDFENPWMLVLICCNVLTIWSKAFVCCSTRYLISFEDVELYLAELLMFVNLSSSFMERLDSFLMSSVLFWDALISWSEDFCTAPIFDLISLVLSMVLFARRRISFATFLKLLLSPVFVVASSSALKAMILVWSEILSMMFAISQMELIFSLRFLIPWIVTSLESAIAEMEERDFESRQVIPQAVLNRGWLSLRFSLRFQSLQWFCFQCCGKDLSHFPLLQRFPWFPLTVQLKLIPFHLRFSWVQKRIHWWFYRTVPSGKEFLWTCWWSGLQDNDWKKIHQKGLYQLEKFWRSLLM